MCWCEEMTMCNWVLKLWVYSYHMYFTVVSCCWLLYHVAPSMCVAFSNIHIYNLYRDNIATWWERLNWNAKGKGGKALQMHCPVGLVASTYFSLARDVEWETTDWAYAELLSHSEVLSRRRSVRLRLRSRSCSHPDPNFVARLVATTTLC